jgi:putative NADH-flavin reductase
MKMAVVGATGRTGRNLLVQATKAGHQVVAVVRDPAKLGDQQVQSVHVADATQAKDLIPAFGGVDAVVFCVGPVAGQSRTIQRDSIAATLDAMTSAGARRLIAISASGGIVAGDDPVTRFIAKPILKRVLRDANADMAAMEDRIRHSTTEWTIVRPPRLTDKAPRGRYRSRRDGNVRWGFQIARADLATSILDALTDPTSREQTISVAS